MALRPGPLQRLYKMTALSGVVLSLPLWLGVLWYAWSAYAEGDRHLRAADPKRPLTAELFQIYLHDTVSADLRRLVLPERPEHGLPTLSLSLSRPALDKLNQGPVKEGQESYVKALVEKDGQVSEARVRRRGGQYWHSIHPQKSLKVRLDKGGLVDGTRVFNLLNDVTPFGLEDQLILDLAREEGLLTPEYKPIRVRLNGGDLGVYRFEAQPDEGLLRRSRRIVGDIISGDTNAMVNGQGAVFADPKAWQKIDAREAAADGNDDSPDGAELVAQIQSASHAGFRQYAERRLDLERYAQFDALDVVFGGSDHDSFSNHKFYVDPYRGVLEPIAYSFRGFQHEPVLNLVDHPLLYRLKMTPGYLEARNRAVYELLTGPASLPEIRARVWKAYAALEGELRADPYWDAYKLLPRVTRFHRFMLRPMSAERWALAAKAELRTFATRSQFLLSKLEGLQATTTLEARHDAPDRLTVRVDGEVAQRLLEVEPPRGCASALRLYADLDRDGELSKSDPLVGEAEAGRPIKLTSLGVLEPGLVAVARPDADAKKGPVSLRAEPRTYAYLLVGAHCAGTATLLLQNLATLATATLQARPGAVAVRTLLPSKDTVPARTAGERSPHLWDFGMPPAPTTVVLGPGRVEVPRTRVFATTETVRIAAGTELSLASGASLVFYGRVEADGTADAPIRFRAQDPAAPFGGLVLNGKGASGSSFVHVELEGGSHPAPEDGDFTGNLTVLEASDVRLEAVKISAHAAADDVLHAIYAERLALNDVEISGSPVDALDLEYSSVDVRGLKVRGAGDDCLDVMGSQVKIWTSTLVACTHNGISAGELTRLSAHTVLIANAKTGVLSKDDSQVRLTAAVIYGAETALETHKKTLYYSGDSAIGADLLYVVACDKVSDASKGTEIEIGTLDATVPDDAAFDPLLAQAALPSWTELGGLPRAEVAP